MSDDDQSLDDEFEDSLKSPANEALERLRARERPTEEDVKLGEPYYKKRADQEQIPFLITQGGLYLGFNGILYPDYRGGQYVRSICQNADRTHRQDQCISPRELDSGGAVGSGGVLYSGNSDGYFERHDDDDGYDWETTYQQAGYEEVFKRDEMRLYVAEIKKLKAEEETAETKELLAFYEKELGLNTYQGRIKSVDPEQEKIRQRVSQNINNFYEMLEGEKYGDDESRIFAAHFRKHIKFRHGNYWYSRKWKYRYF